MTYYERPVTLDITQESAITDLYALAGVEEPNRVTELHKLIQGAPTAHDIALEMAREAFTADDAEAFYRTAIDRITEARSADLLRDMFSKALDGHTRATMPEILTRTVADVTPVFTKLIKSFKTAAKDLPIGDPLNLDENIEAGTGTQYKTARDALTTLSTYAGIYLTLTHHDIPNAAAKLLPLVELPDPNVEITRALGYSGIYNTLNGAELTGTYTIRDLVNTAAKNIDHALIGVARGDFPGVSLKLATPEEYATRANQFRVAHERRVKSDDGAVMVL